MPEVRTSTILMVDDEDMVRLLCVRILTEAGYRASEARNGDEALELLSAGCPDLLITDSSMPVLSGFGLILEARSRYPSLPILRISGSYGSPGLRDQIPPDIMTLHKPFGGEELLAAVGRLLEVGQVRELKTQTRSLRA